MGGGALDLRRLGAPPEPVHTGDASWPVELVGHHASLPLAFAILYQDFPFALADLFLKRALTLLALVAAPFVAVATLHVGPVVGSGALHDVRDVALLVTLWVATALCYPKLRDLAAWFVDAVVLDRPDYDALRAAIARTAQSHEDIGLVLDEACAQLAPALSARVVRWRELPPRSRRRRPRPSATPQRHGHRRDPGRRAAALRARRRRADRRPAAALRTTAPRSTRSPCCSAAASTPSASPASATNASSASRRSAQLATEAELRALRAQINPHFLFNALTTIGYLIQTAPPRALDTLMRLTALLRGVLRSEGELTTLGRELDLIESYLDIERARFEQRLRVRIDVPARSRAFRVPPLLLQPIVENAVKHGIAPAAARRRGDGDRAARGRRPRTRDALHGRARQRRRRVGRGAAFRPRGRRRPEERRAAARVPVRRVRHGHDSERPGAGTTVEIRMPAEYRLAELTPSRSAS